MGAILRKYLNKTSRDYVALTFRFVDLLDKQEQYILDSKNKHEEDKEKLKYLRTAITYIKKYLDIWLNNVENEELKRLLKLVETTELMLKDNYQTRLQLKEWENAISNRKLEVHQDLIEDLLDIAIKKECIGCNKGKDEAESCRLRKAMIRYDAPATVEDPKTCEFEC